MRLLRLYASEIACRTWIRLGLLQHWIVSDGRTRRLNVVVLNWKKLRDMKSEQKVKKKAIGLNLEVGIVCPITVVSSHLRLLLTVVSDTAIKGHVTTTPKLNILRCFLSHWTPQTSANNFLRNANNADVVVKRVRSLEISSPKRWTSLLSKAERAKIAQNKRI